MLVWGFGLSESEAFPLFLEYNARCDPPWSEHELMRMLKSAVTRGGDKPRGHMVGDGQWERGEGPEIEIEKPRSKKREHDLEAIKRAQEGGFPIDMRGWRAWLRERSPYDPGTLTPEQYLDGLYKSGEKILIFCKMWATQGDFGRVIGKSTRRLGRYPDSKPEKTSLPDRSPEGMIFLMQPVDNSWHPVNKPYGKVELSRRTERSVTRWPYILLENDKVPHELWLNVLVRARVRIVSITMSGGRSLHALVKLDKETKQDLADELKTHDAEETLTVLGCDPQAARNFMTCPRLPNTWREGKRAGKVGLNGEKIFDDRNKRVMVFSPFRNGPSKQALLYYNPSAALGQSIAEGPRFERE
jgi:hypothetical protein